MLFMNLQTNYIDQSVKLRSVKAIELNDNIKISNQNTNLQLQVHIQIFYVDMDIKFILNRIVFIACTILLNYCINNE